MVIINLIILGIIIICLVIIIIVVVRKFPQLSQLDVKTIPQAREEQAKKRIIKEKLERDLLVQMRKGAKKLRPLLNKLILGFKNIFDRTLALERSYRQKLEPKTPQEQEKVDVKTDDLVKAGVKLLAEEKFSEAEKKFIDALTLDANDTEAYQGLGELYWQQGKLKEAKQTFEHILRLNADSYDAHSYLGNISLKEGNLEEAREHHQKSIELDSQAAVHYLDLAEVCRQLDDLEEAFNCLEKAVGLEPNNPRNLDAFIDLSIMMGKKKEAREALRTLKEVNPENQKIKEFESRIRKIK